MINKRGTTKPGLSQAMQADAHLTHSSAWNINTRIGTLYALDAHSLAGVARKQQTRPHAAWPCYTSVMDGSEAGLSAHIQKSCRASPQ